MGNSSGDRLWAAAPTGPQAGSDLKLTLRMRLLLTHHFRSKTSCAYLHRCTSEKSLVDGSIKGQYEWDFYWLPRKDLMLTISVQKLLPLIYTGASNSEKSLNDGSEKPKWLPKKYIHDLTNVKGQGFRYAIPNPVFIHIYIYIYIYIYSLDQRYNFHSITLSRIWWNEQPHACNWIKMNIQFLSIVLRFKNVEKVRVIHEQIRYLSHVISFMLPITKTIPDEPDMQDTAGEAGTSS